MKKKIAKKSKIHVNLLDSTVSLIWVYMDIYLNPLLTWISGRVLDSRWRGCGFEPHRRLCFVSFSKTLNWFNPDSHIMITEKMLTVT